MKPRLAPPMRITARVREANLGARVMRIPSQMELGNRERDRLYRCARWRRERLAFLVMNPMCACGEAATIVDHRDGHQREDWRERFWDVSTWQPMCMRCHADKSARELAAWRASGEAIT